MEDAAQGVAQIERPPSSRESYQHLEILAGLDLRTAKMCVELKDLSKMSHSMRKEFDTATDQARRHIRSLEATLLEHAKALRELQHRFDRQPDERKQPMSPDRLRNSSELPLSSLEVAGESKIAELRSTLKNEILQELSMQGFNSAPEERKNALMGNATGAEIGTAQIHANCQPDQCKLDACQVDIIGAAQVAPFGEHEGIEQQGPESPTSGNARSSEGSAKTPPKILKPKGKTCQSLSYHDAEEMTKEEAFTTKLEESMWDAAIIIGMPVAGTLGSVMALVGLIICSSLQWVMLDIVVTVFLESDLQITVDWAKEWRETMGHNWYWIGDGVHYYLVSRVCAPDKQLTYQTIPRDAVQAVNRYLENQVGPMLCLVTVFIWYLAIAQELHRVADHAMAFWELPKHPTQIVIQDGMISLKSVSWSRFLVLMTVVAIRFVVAVFLLICGSAWLCSTLDIRDLVLNGAALAFIMEIDELVFAAICPKSCKLVLRNMEPLRLPTSRTWKGMDNTTALTFFFSIVSVTSLGLLFLWPFTSELVATREALCEGQRNFVYLRMDNGALVHAPSPNFPDTRPKSTYIQDAVTALVKGSTGQPLSIATTSVADLDQLSWGYATLNYTALCSANQYAPQLAALACTP